MPPKLSWYPGIRWLDALVGVHDGRIVAILHCLLCVGKASVRQRRWLERSLQTPA
jgi:hypothetical protein